RNAQQGELPPKTLPPSPPPPPIEGRAPQIALRSVKVEAFDFGLLTDDCRLLTVLPLASPPVAVVPTRYGEKPVLIDTRVMPWQTAPQKSGISGTTASIRPSKKWHKRSTFGAHRATSDFLRP